MNLGELYARIQKILVEDPTTANLPVMVRELGGSTNNLAVIHVSEVGNYEWAGSILELDSGSQYINISVDH